MTEHPPTTEAHTCHDHCPCQPEPEFKLGKPYIIPADAKNRFREYAVEALDKALRETWERTERMLTTFPADAPSNPAPDLARDDDAQSELGDIDRDGDDALRIALAAWKSERAEADRLRSELADAPEGEHTCHEHCPCQPDDYHPQIRDEIHSRLLDLDGCTNQATAEELVNAVVGPELDRHIGAHRRDNQRHANTAKVLRAELADMTAQRDRVEAKRDIETRRANAAELKWNDAEARAKLYLKERDEALKERDDAIRGSDAVAAKLVDLRVRHNYLHDEDCPSNEWGDDDCHCSGKNGRLPNEADRLLDERDEAWEGAKQMAVQRDTAQAEVKELREKLEHWTSGRRRKAMPLVKSVPHAISSAAAMARASHDPDLPDEIGDMLRGAAWSIRTLHDTASTLTAERDALQARIDSTRHELLDWRRNPEERCKAAYNALIPDRDWEPVPPADDGSCGASHYGKCGPKNLDCLRREIPLPADDGSEAAR